MTALVDRHGRETILATMEELLEYTERRTRAELAALPHGVYEAEGSVDNDGYTDEPVRLKARVELDADGVRFDLTGSDPQRRAPVNSTYAMSFSACAYALKCLIDPICPSTTASTGSSACTRRPGTVTNCTWPAPVVGGWETHARLIEVIVRALLPAFPERLPAGTKGMMCQAGFGSLDVAAGKYTCFYDTFAGGYGGRYASDGPDAVQSHGQNTENAPIEETELNYPVRINGLSLVEDSEGPGRFRGGLGLRKDYLFDLHTTFTVLADRDKVGPWGAFGGHAGRIAEYVHVRDGVETRLSSKTTLDLVPGDVISVRTCGGGGYGPPEERDPERVLRDVLEGKVSAERARDVYRVAIADRRLDDGGDGEALRRMSVRVAVDIGGTFTDATLIDEETGAVSIAKVLTTPADPSEGFMQAVDRALADGSVAARAGRLRRPRDDRGDERDHRGQDRARRLRHDRGLPRPARDRPPGAAVPLRHPVREGEAARPPRPRRDGRRAARPGRRGAAAARGRLRARGGRDPPARGGRVGRRLPAPRLRQPGARAAGRRDPRRGAARRSRSRCPPRSRPSSASTCAPRRP